MDIKINVNDLNGGTVYNVSASIRLVPVKELELNKGSILQIPNGPLVEIVNVKYVPERDELIIDTKYER